MDNGVLLVYNNNYVFETDYAFADGIRYVSAAADGTVYVAANDTVYAKKATETAFTPVICARGRIDRLNVGIGGKVVYVLSGNVINPYTPTGEPLTGELAATQTVVDFSVDYRGNVFILSASGEIARYARTVNGYLASQNTYVLARSFTRYDDIAIDRDGTVYVTADHNVLAFAKSVFGVITSEDSDFEDRAENEPDIFVCEVVSHATVAYVAPDNFEDISYIPEGTKLMCYARVEYASNEYLRVETEKGTAYVPAEDVRIFTRHAAAPMQRARCLHTKKGVNVYEYPSHIGVASGVAPIFSALMKEAVFEVNEYVAVDADGMDAWGFYQVTYEGRTGYVLIADVVTVDGDLVPIERYKLKIKAEKLGKTVALYEDASVESSEVARLSDGTEIYALEPLDPNKDFIKVLYEGRTCYVQPMYLGEGGLSAGQTLAIVLSVVTVTASIVMYLIFRAGKRRKVVYKE